MAPLSLCLVLFFAAGSLAAEVESLTKPPKCILDVDEIDLESVGCQTIKCPRIGPPICVRQKNKLVLFPTSCALASFGCACRTGQTWIREKLELCAKRICPVDCNATEEYPVCASHGNETKTFKSECEFRNYACANFDKPWSRNLDC